MGFWKDFGSVLGNLAILAVKTAGTVVSVAGAIASEGVTAPLAAISFASTASSWFDFIKNPTGNVNRSIMNGAKWVADTIGAGSADRVIGGINAVANLDPFTSTASSIGLPTVNVTTAPNLAQHAAREAKRVVTGMTRGMGIDTADASSIVRIVSPAMRNMEMAQGNRVDRTRSDVLRQTANLHSLPEVRITRGQ